MTLKKVFSNILILCIFFGLSCHLNAETQNVKFEAPLFNNLGTFHYPISTKVPLAQRFFDQGLTIYSDSFSYSLESIRSFREAIRQDPTCAMCYWGLALALIPKTYMPKEGLDKFEGYTAIRKAQQLVNPN